MLCGMWDLPGLGIKPVSPGLVARFLVATVPPEKSQEWLFNSIKPGLTGTGNSPFDLLVLQDGERLSHLGILCLLYRCGVAQNWTRLKRLYSSSSYKGELLKLVTLKHFDLH